ncbi:MAG: exopolysaccharide biosynthesis polyprenyl glycosylphosphotransferase [Sphingomonadaceae bacterium]
MEAPPRALMRANGRAGTRLRVEVLVALTGALAIPALIAIFFFREPALPTAEAQLSLALSGLAALASVYIRRQLAPFPGIRAAEHALPGLVLCYSLAIGAVLLLRLDYSRVILFSGFIACLAGQLLLLARMRSGSAGRFWLVPLGRADRLRRIANAGWTTLDAPRVPAAAAGQGIAADLHSDLPDAWERMLAEAVLRGIPVYHFKQLEEALTGRVDIEHMAENTLGSLTPDRFHYKFKRAADLTLALILLPVLLPLFALVALAIKLDSSGPVIFRQERMGERGKPFRVIKFRTMTDTQDRSDARASAITQSGDQRITRIGGFLRRTRIDELPQIFNVLAGQMSWIGPRPEALALSQWYDASLPFYAYRHIVKPGITGWAQVNQGHVAELPEVHDKLRYDFFYIKNFSAWLDLLILARTLRVVASGFGAK